MNAAAQLRSRLVLGPSGETVSPSVNREAWKVVRGPLIGSSDVAAILGRDEYTGAWGVWDRIVLREWDEGESADQRRGNRQEANALARFTETLGLTHEPLGMIRHADDPRLVSDIDALIHRPEVWPEAIADSVLWAAVRETSGPGAAEVKVPRVARYYRYRDEGVPVGHVIQMQHHLEIAGLEWGCFIVYTPEYDDALAVPVTRDPEWGAWVMDALDRWWVEHVETRTRPTRPAPEPPRWPNPVPGEAARRVDDAWLEWAELVVLRHYELAEAKAAYAETEERLLELLGDDEQHVAGGGVTVKRRTTASQRRTDFKALRAAVKVAQQSGDPGALLAIDPDSDAFHYHTQGSEKVDVVVTRSNPMEVMA